MAGTSGIAYWVDEAWRRAARARLKELGWKQVDLAREARVKPNTITTLLGGGEGGTSTHVHLPRIHAALGWPKPNPPLHPERVRMLIELFAHAATVEDELRIIEVIRAALGVAKRGG